MNRRTWWTRALLAVAALATLNAAPAPAGENTLHGARYYRRSQAYTWHGNHYHTSYGAPVALVVPPTAEMQTNYHWGVAGYRTSPIYHQYRRGYPGMVGVPGAYFRPTPQWPSDTDQFGVHYIRAPW